MPLPRQESRLLLGLLALGYLVFVVYGSLVPLDYTPVPWDEAVERFRNIRFLQLGIGSRADWVANLLLFIPLTFLWLGWLWPRWEPSWHAHDFALDFTYLSAGQLAIYGLAGSPGRR